MKGYGGDEREGRCGTEGGKKPGAAPPQMPTLSLAGRQWWRTSSRTKPIANYPTRLAPSSSDQTPSRVDSYCTHFGPFCLFSPCRIEDVPAEATSTADVRSSSRMTSHGPQGQDNLSVPFMPSYVLPRSPSVSFRLTSLQQTPIFLYFRPFCLERFLNNGLSGLSPASSK
jgi:hypothetical protein